MIHYETSIRTLKVILDSHPKSVREQLRPMLPQVRARMAELLEQRGWIQHQLEFEKSVCLVGAMRMAVHEEAKGDCRFGALLGMTELSLMEDLQEYTENSGLYLSEWNDVPGRTAAEVIAFLRHEPLVAIPAEESRRS